jgi:hypothetical protein
MSSASWLRVGPSAYGGRQPVRRIARALSWARLSTEGSACMARYGRAAGQMLGSKLAIDWATAGDDEPVPMLERPHVKAMQHEPDARQILASQARNVRQAAARTAPSTRSSSPPPGSTPTSARSPKTAAPSASGACGSWPRPSPTAARSNQT